MEEKEARKRREWVKNAAIIFLAVMLVLTFFSNTIMNYSLPEVATQYVQRGSITAKVRGTGNVVATDPYNVIVKESRVISSVAVKQGDEVEKDQVLYYLEDEESEELKQAEAELEDLKLNYMKGLFGSNVSPEIINKVASGNVDGFSALQAKVTDMQKRLDDAEARVKACQENLDKISLQSTLNTNNSSVSTIPYEEEIAQTTTNLENAQVAFENAIAKRKAELTNEIAEWEHRIADLQALIDNAENVTETKTDNNLNVDIDNNGDNNTNTINGVPIEKTTLLAQYEEMRKEASDKQNKILDQIYDSAQKSGYSGEKNINSLKEWLGDREDYKDLLQDYDSATAQYKYAVELINEATKNMSQYESNNKILEGYIKSLNAVKAELTRVQAITYQSGDDYRSAQEKLNQAKQNLNDVTNANKQTAAAYQNQIANAEAALKTAQSVYDLLKEEQELMNADINAELDLSKASRDIIAKQEEVARLKEKSIGAEITAPVAGTVTTLAYKAGETTNPEEPAAVIQIEGKGYTLSISVTNDQARKVQVGDEAEIQNSWYYDDVHMILTSIKPDPDAPGQKQLLNFDVTGSNIQDGQALNISVGQRSSEYELVVPNSAVREDNNGKFILIVESKSSPLGNRYIATRVDVDVLASDDNNTAISAPLYGYEYVITTSTKPVEAGKQVRLNQ